MNKLPEELIFKIVAYLAPHPSDLYDISQLRDLANLPRISRRLERISTPHLYKSVLITVCKVGQNITVAVGAVDAPPMVLDIITTKGRNAQKFLKTLQHRPAPREFVKYVSLLRDDRGFLWRLSLGWYGYSEDSSATANFHWREIEKAARTGLPISTSRILRTHPVAPVACLDEGFETVRELLRLLPKIEHLNCHKYRTDLPWHPAAETFQTLRWRPMPQNDFRSLRSLKQLVLDVTDLLEVVKLSELCDQHTGILTPITFVMGEEILINADLTLPNSLEVLIRRVSNGDKQRAGTTKALRALVLDSKARLPYLRVLRTAWQVPCTTPSGDNLRLVPKTGEAFGVN
ncbi:hypothetical protein N0V87_000947 [Didymella glomerata]|uniref:F-box domain-containing protein n=1 Tax=Didymella glomerata TaxID=749621 RepID=A0A9W9C494_9PLEO|nr:hypothetical protein N0V87_000947 [Didymella glomerata]